MKQAPPLTFKSVTEFITYIVAGTTRQNPIYSTDGNICLFYDIKEDNPFRIASLRTGAEEGADLVWREWKQSWYKEIPDSTNKETLEKIKKEKETVLHVKVTQTEEGSTVEVIDISKNRLQVVGAAYLILTTVTEG